MKTFLKIKLIAIILLFANICKAQFTPPTSPYINGPYTAGTTNISTLPIYVHGSTVADMIYLGKGAGANSSFTTESTALGVGALSLNYGGRFNTAVGFKSLYSTDGGFYNVALGGEALYSNVLGYRNTAVGYRALFTISNAQDNVAVGSSALLLSGSNGNVAVGSKALIAQTSGDANTAVGFNALAANQTGRLNVAVGSGSLAGWNGNYNTAFGSGSMPGTGPVSGAGNENTSIGYWSLKVMTCGEYNAVIGANSMLAFQNGDQNTVLGVRALTTLTSGNNNVGLGFNALWDLTSGNSNLALGTGARVPLDPGTTNNKLSIQNVIYGANMTSAASGIVSIGVTGGPAQITGGGLSNTGYAKLHVGGTGVLSPSLQLDYVPTIAGTYTGKYLVVDASGVVCKADVPAGGSGNYWSLTGNTGITDANFIGTTSGNAVLAPFNILIKGARAGRIDPTDNNVFFGYLAGAITHLNGGKDNIALGTNALLSNTTTGNNVAIGSNALSANTADDNIAIGTNALVSNTLGFRNVAIGRESLFTDINSTDNIAIGYNALRGSAASGPHSLNTAVGSYALTSNHGDHNSAFGCSSLRDNVDGDANTAIGFGAMRYLQSGDANTAVGVDALPNLYHGDSNTALGTNADVAEGSTEATAIGAGSYAALNHSIQLGSPTVQYVFVGNTTDGAIPTGILVTNQLNVTSPTGPGYVLTDVGNTGYATWQPLPASCCEKVSSLETEMELLKKQNEELKKEMEEIKSLIKSTKVTDIQGSVKITQSNVDAQLFQNAPNPFTKSTVIKYSIPVTAKKAMLTITSINGLKIKEFDLKNKNAQSVEINARELSAGTYIYSLIVDDTFIDAKQMVLTR